MGQCSIFDALYSYRLAVQLRLHQYSSAIRVVDTDQAAADVERDNWGFQDHMHKHSGNLQNSTIYVQSFEFALDISI